MIEGRTGGVGTSGKGGRLSGKAFLKLGVVYGSIDMEGLFSRLLALFTHSGFGIQHG
jgi:hypothetical protein